jgi:hypothetical protein
MNALSQEALWAERPFIEYLCEVDRLLHEQFGIESVDLEFVAAAQEARETPQEHVDWIAEHYDLEPLPR